MLFVEQVKVLTKKNVQLQLRNRAATATQLLIGVFFLFLLMVMDQAMKAARERDQSNTYTEFPNIVSAGEFKHCTRGSQDPCFDFVWGTDKTIESDSVFQDIQQVVTATRNVLGTNEDSILHVGNKTEMDIWLANNPNRTLAAVYFVNAESWKAPSGSLGYVLRFNRTLTCAALGAWSCDDPMAQVAVPLQLAIDSAFLSVFNHSNSAASGEEVPKIFASFSDFPHPDLPSYFDVVAAYGPTFLYIAASFNYVIQLTLIVEEKELHLVEALKQMGMLQSAYWFSWLLVNCIVNTVMVLLLVAFGAMLQLELFQETALGLLLSFFWVSSMAFTAMAFLFSTLTRTTSSARLLGIFVFIITFIAAPLLVQLLLMDGSDSYDSVRSILSLFPVFAFYHVLSEFIQRSSGAVNDGMRWNQRQVNLLPSDPTNSAGDSFWSIEDSIVSMVKGFLIMTIAAWYLEQVLPNEHGHRESVLFFLKPTYWFPSLATKRRKAPRHPVAKVTPVGKDEDPHVDEDVKAEAEQVRNDNFEGRDVAVKVKQLTKTFRKGFFGFKEAFHAVRSIEYAIEKNSTFVMLGHNGAGKSTSINMLTGLSDVTSGDAEIFGYSVVQEMNAIQSIMGVCPQHDILWDKLTAREHLRLFATIKKVPSDQIEAEVNKRLKQTLLEEAADKPSWTFSGGMKRRLSIAIALIGDPKIVFLDEPTTGMDPLTRRQVWNMIAEAKKGRVIFLTTHSMEEADCLGDRIAVMSKGRLQAIGSSIRLKSKFGSGYQMSILKDKTTDLDTCATKVQEFLKEHAPVGSSELTKSMGGVLSLELPAIKSKNENQVADGKPSVTPDDLVTFFESFEAAKESLGVKDYSINQCTLENVFLHLSKMDEFIKEEEEKATQELSFEGKQVGMMTQFKALFIKSWQYQKSQRISCVCTIFFPVFIMCILLLVEVAVFGNLRLTIVCGNGVSKSECLNKGIDLDCVAEQFKFTRPSIPKPIVGSISLNGRYGGINPNCDSNGCFDGLEQPLYHEIPVYAASTASGVGHRELTFSDKDVAKKFQHWYADLGFLVMNETCKDLFDENFDESKACKDAGFASMMKCQQDVRALRNARDYLAADVNASTSWTCERAENGGFQVPEATFIAQVEALLEKRSMCERGELSQILMHLGARDPAAAEESAWDIASALETLTAAENVSQSGVLGSFTSNMFGDDILDGVLGRLGLGTFIAPPYGGCSRLLVFILLNATVTNSLGMSQDAVEQAADGICSLLEKIDLVRGLSFAQGYATPEAFRKQGFLEKWNGEELQTERMKAESPLLRDSEKYRARFYMSHWKGYEIHEMDQTKNIYNYTAFFNNSGTGGYGHGNWLAATWAMNNAIVRKNTGRSLLFMTEEFPRSFQCNRDAWLRGEEKSLECDLLPRILALSILDFIALQLFPYLLMIHMFLLVGLVVYEKENRLRMIMKMMGLSMRVYWVVNYLFYFFQYFLMIAMMWLMGTAANLQLFVLHDPAVVFFFLFTWGNLLIVFSFFLSVFFKSSRSSTAAIFLFVLIINTTGFNLLDTFTQDPSTPEASFVPLMLVPPLAMVRALYWLAVSAAFKEQITWATFSTYGGGGFARSINWMWFHIFIFGILLWYLDNVLAVGYGVPKPKLFFLKKDYWFPAKPSEEYLATTVDALQKIPLAKMVKEQDIPSDVKEEYERAVHVADAQPQPMLRAVRLHKKFSDKVAVRSFSLAVNQKECFALLGHNGAGKTTTINMLTGLFEPSSGTALVEGFSIRTDMSKIYQRMGVCPQHDILWESLTGIDHLRFFGRLKGLRGRDLTLAVRQALKDVNLEYAASRPAGTYSGGMKRRLSTAMSIIGNPKIVYLDEPSTGLDPASRQQLWSVIGKAKGNKSILLTSHSMEEVEVLSDRIGIMSDGLFQCIGTSAELKQRFGNGYSLFVTTRDRSDEAHKRMLDFVLSNFSQAKLRNEQLAGTSNFEIPRQQVVLSRVFRIFEEAREELGIVDWSVSESTLEDVFLHLASHQ